MPAGRFRNARFPSGQGRGIDAQQPSAGHSPQPLAGTRPDESGGQVVRLWQRVVAEEANDGREVSEFGFYPALLPVPDRGFVHPGLGGGLALEQAQIEPPFSDMVTDGHKGRRITWILGVRR